MPALRITSGTLRGRRIPLRPDVRPTSERARQAFFNIVAPRLDQTRFLDLFAGTGAFAFEAVSRGAASARAVEISRPNVLAIETLASTWGVPVRAIQGDVLRVLPSIGAWDLAYADPPYDFARYDELLSAIDSVARPGSMVGIEHRRRSEPFTVSIERLRLVRRAEYGEIWISLFEFESQSTSVDHMLKEE